MTEKIIPPLPDAPASINFHVVDEAGFAFQITLRDYTENALMGRVNAIRKWLMDNGFVPRGKQAATPGWPSDLESPVLPDLPNADPGYCKVHDTKMFENSNERGTWWSHKTDDPAYSTGFCKGKPAK